MLEILFALTKSNDFIQYYYHPFPLSNIDESTFHFHPVFGTPATMNGKNKTSLCQEVPALFGIGNARRQSKSICKSSSSQQTNPNNRGFYKRLLEWLSSKKKTRRRFSVIPVPDTCQMESNSEESLHVPISVNHVRNQSVPMIFDARRSPPRFKCPTIEQVASVDEEQLDSQQAQPVTSHIFGKQESEEKLQEIDAEWIIPWNDIQIGQAIAQGGSCTIHRWAS